MNISILSVFPDLYQEFLRTSLLSRAQEQKLFSFHLDSFFSHVKPKERIDGPVVGHNSGMVIKPTVVERAIDAQEKKLGRAFRVMFAPHGKTMDQGLLYDLVGKLSSIEHLMLIAARYEGMDERVEEEYADLIISVGDFVVMGGDVPAMLFLEGLLRLVPGVLGNKNSLSNESFAGPFLDYPSYTLPVVWKNRTIPEVLRSGNHALIAQFQEKVAIDRTIVTHFNWLRSSIINREQKKRCYESIPSHYIALLHDQVLLPQGLVGTTSVTSMDIHDIARSAKTYGFKNYSIVTPLKDQQKIVRTMLDFWQEGHGVDYNPQRHEAVKLVLLHESLQEVIDYITQKEGIKPIIVSTSARSLSHNALISYSDQGLVWEKKRPVLFVFGTGKGLAPQIIDQCDFLLTPVIGLTDFNHLSVRSAVAVVFDRWLGLYVPSAGNRNKD